MLHYLKKLVGHVAFSFAPRSLGLGVEIFEAVRALCRFWQQNIYNRAAAAMGPSDATYELRDKSSLAKFLQDADIRLIRAEYLFKMRRSEIPLPRRQEAESQSCEINAARTSALVTHEEVKEWAAGRQDAIVCSVSHAWGTREHPDPCCFQLGLLVDCISLYDAAYHSKIWVFYDYTSLYQYMREGHEQRSYNRAMKNVQVMYAHECSLSLRIVGLTPDDIWTQVKESERGIRVYHLESKGTAALPLRDLMHNRRPYEERGWCMAETEWSSTRSASSQNQRIGSEPLEVEDFRAKVPMSPEVFEKQMLRAAFTWRDDCQMVVALQHRIFHEKVTACREVVLENLPEHEVEELLKVFPHYQQLEAFRLRGFEASPVQAKALVELLLSSRATEVELRQGILAEAATGEALAKAMAAGLKQNRSSVGVTWAWHAHPSSTIHPK